MAMDKSIRTNYNALIERSMDQLITIDTQTIKALTSTQIEQEKLETKKCNRNGWNFLPRSVEFNESAPVLTDLLLEVIFC